MANLGTDTLARQTFDRECYQNREIPSLISETRPYLEELGISDLHAFTKMQYRIRRISYKCPKSIKR